MRIRMGARLRALVAVLAATLTLGALAVAPAEVGAQSNPYQRGRRRRWPRSSSRAGRSPRPR
jgi:hypothetical protein